MCSWQLPAGAQEEVLRRYADLLRVGRLSVQGRVTSWKTETSSELQLQGFCEAFGKRLQELLPELANTPVLPLAAYWLLKAVSINYALIEVVLMVRRQVGVLCSIETREDCGGALVEYQVEVRPGPVLRVSLGWRKGNNIVYRDPKTAHRKVKGSLSRLATEFELPPRPNCLPEYSLDLRLKKSLAAAVAAKISCACSNSKDDVRGNGRHQVLSINEPLDNGNLVEAASAARCSLRAPGSFLLDDAGDEDEDEATTPSEPPSNDEEGLDTIETWGSHESSSEEASVGHLRARVLRAGLDDVLRPGAKWAKPMLYVSCIVAGRTERSRIVPSCSRRPQWNESWDFPLTAKDLRGEVRMEIFGVDTAKGELELLGSATALVSLALAGAGAVTVSAPLSGVSLGFLEMELEMLPDVVSSTKKTVEHGATISVEQQQPHPRTSSRDLPDLSLQVHVRAVPAQPRFQPTCGLWCSRPCTAECS